MNNRYLGYLRTAGVVPLLIMFAVLFALLPLVGRYSAEVIIRLAIIFIAVAAFRFIVSMGRWSFVHAQLFGMGGYTSAILTMKLGYPFWLTLFLGGFTAALIALIISYPVLRTKGFYFFMSTFVIGAAIVWIWRRYFLFGGTSGLTGIPRPDPISIAGLTLNFGDWLTYAFVVVGVSLVCLLVLYRLEKTRLSSILKSIGSSRDLVRSVGLSTMKYETIGFVIGSFFAGIAGVLFVHNSGVATPADFGTTLGMNIIAFTLVGGVNSFWGPLIGVSVLTVITELLRGYREVMPLIYGIIIIAAVLALPGGLISLPQRIKEWRQGRFSLSFEADKIPIVRDMMIRRRK